jgi:hypothetical protein
MVMDGVSMEDVLEDFYRIYSALNSKEINIIPKETISLIDWQKRSIHMQVK